ncbi:mitochondrial bifunctional methylenetetrahydrofolate dehydrogenase/methenyltetrahydrofolate cyclohydrolase [Andalucia godoyi]|uniref:Mitochondrial bifunctional methylenetetrahydrofolate dehydrogenase/methenyltetrahydrofolate cyclohydrolase n=1 Tax=Andalucia godoyi TaxID=505711 RepID=A0A8K0F0N1_ANDGO|nr:mitochondrial bifunctional methylenetetrahydrofolate dehydrogenase/methenyltetrahydrofolate cyclohydrolase [Andalucia godoyi]|eukprot:ANDGO_01673.mRNA.1 mitochondrial bifunctional methylenetetrahydrofolate dehydrogenase/methenyltetrahydrofolate cyclohydrolase
MSRIIDGKAIAATIRSEVAARVSHLRSLSNRVPHLAVVLVGERPDSATYVRMKSKAAEECGMVCRDVHVPASVTEKELLSIINDTAADPAVSGILVQLPLPSHIHEPKILAAVPPSKDVDGFDRVHIGDLALKGHTPLFVPCTPQGCLELLVRSGVTLKGAKAVVIGRSNIVGLPMALLLLKSDCTVTVCHSQTATDELIRELKSADVVIAAIGRPEFVKGEWIKPGAVVIDVGMNAVERNGKQKLVGDVAYEEVFPVAGMITPVPGGVGPMTVACLMRNTLRAFESQLTNEGMQLD